jgi:hypothetical protein
MVVVLAANAGVVAAVVRHGSAHPRGRLQLRLRTFGGASRESRLHDPRRLGRRSPLFR